MLSMSAISKIGGGIAGAAGIGYLSHQRDAIRHPERDASDKMGHTAMFAAFGAAAGVGLATLGMGGIGRAGKSVAKGASVFGKAMMANPLRGKRSGLEMAKAAMKFEIPHTGMTVGGSGVLKGLALAAAGIGTMAYGASRNRSAPGDVGSRDGYGGTSYTSVKERAAMMSASGDMVMGLHNARHG